MFKNVYTCAFELTVMKSLGGGMGSCSLRKTIAETYWLGSIWSLCPPVCRVDACPGPPEVFRCLFIPWGALMGEIMGGVEGEASQWANLVSCQSCWCLTVCALFDYDPNINCNTFSLFPFIPFPSPFNNNQTMTIMSTCVKRAPCFFVNLLIGFWKSITVEVVRYGQAVIGRT